MYVLMWQLSDELVTETGIQLTSSSSSLPSVVHQPLQQPQQQAHQQVTASATTGQPLQHAAQAVGQTAQLPHTGTVNVPPSWLLPLPNNEFLVNLTEYA